MTTQLSENMRFMGVCVKTKSTRMIRAQTTPLGSLIPLVKEMYCHFCVYVIKKIGELASRSSWLSGKASGHESRGKPKVCDSRLTR